MFRLWQNNGSWKDRGGVWLFLATVGLVVSLTFKVRAVDAAASGGGGGLTSFEDWVILHEKSYSDSEEFAFRQTVYHSNCQRWDQLNQIPGGAKFGPELEPHADLTPEEFVMVRASCASVANNAQTSFDEPKTTTQQQRRLRRQTTFAKKAKAQHKGNNDNIVYVDWRNKNGLSYVTPPKSQGAHGTCWSFAAAENLEGLNVRQGYPLVNISEQEFISCCAQCQGRSQDYTFEWLVNTTNGQPALEDSYPYDGNANVTCRAADAPRAPVKLHSWARIGDDGTGVPILLGLGYHGPMSLGVDARCFFGYKGGIIRNCTHGGINHAVSMIAAGADVYYDDDDDNDDENKNQPNFVDYFTIKNSWGGKWGEGGYVRIEQGQNWWGPVNVIYTE